LYPIAIVHPIFNGLCYSSIQKDLWFQLWLEQRPERRAKEKEKRKLKMQQMALIKGFTESRSASRKRLKHEQGTTGSVCLAVEQVDADNLCTKTEF
jgi:hypothetical protein